MLILVEVYDGQIKEWLELWCKQHGSQRRVGTRHYLPMDAVYEKIVGFVPDLILADLCTQS